MTKSRRKRHRFDKGAEARRVAREKAGQPPPTKIFDNHLRALAPIRADDFSGTLEKEREKAATPKDFTVDWKPSVKASDEPGPSAGAPTLTHVPRTVHAPVRMVQRPSERSGDTLPYSDEVKAHANFLLTTQGAEASRAYLDRVREGKPMDEQSVVAKGPMEKQIDETQEKLRVLRQEDLRIRDEITRYEMILESLQKVVGLYAAPRAQLRAAANGNAPPTTESGRVKWMELITQALPGFSPRPSKKQLIAKLKEMSPDSSDIAIYASVSGYIKHGKLVLASPDCIYLPGESPDGRGGLKEATK